MILLVGSDLKSITTYVVYFVKAIERGDDRVTDNFNCREFFQPFLYPYPLHTEFH